MVKRFFSNELFEYLTTQGSDSAMFGVIFMLGEMIESIVDHEDTPAEVNLITKELIAALAYDFQRMTKKRIENANT